jgi:hypothetical protein
MIGTHVAAKRAVNGSGARPDVPRLTPRSGRSSAYPVAQVEHAVALDHHVGVLQQVLRVD